MYWPFGSLVCLDAHLPRPRWSGESLELSTGQGTLTLTSLGHQNIHIMGVWISRGVGRMTGTYCGVPHSDTGPEDLLGAVWSPDPTLAVFQFPQFVHLNFSKIKTLQKLRERGRDREEGKEGQKEGEGKEGEREGGVTHVRREGRADLNMGRKSPDLKFLLKNMRDPCPHTAAFCHTAVG